MFKKFRNIFSGSTFTVIDVDIATGKYIGIYEFSAGAIVKGLASVKELNEDNYFEVK